MINSFDEKLNKLPKEAQDILLLETGVRLEKFLERKYEVTYGESNIGELLCMIYFKEISLEKVYDFFVKNFKIKVKEKINPFLTDLIGIRVLSVREHLKNEDFEYIIHSLGGDIEDYKKFINFTKEAVEKESRGEIVDINKILGIEEEEEEEEFEEEKIGEINFNAKKEKKDSFKIFENSIKHLLVNVDKNVLESYNLTLLELITEDIKFKRDLENSLYHNKETITTSKFKLKDVPEKPTIGNWLKDFIKKNGTTIFSDVVLSEYLTRTDNTKNLYTNERVLLSKLLQLYRNLKFYPESQKGVREDDWEIIPAEEIKEKESKRKTIGTPKTIAEKNIEKMKEEASHYGENSLEHLAVEEEIEYEKKIEELRFMATKFAEGSLEKKAIEEELKKMEHLK